MSRPVRRLLAGMLALGVLAGLPAAPVSAAPAIRLDILVGFVCVSGQGPADKRHEVTLRTPDGTVRGRSADRSDQHGNFSGCFFDGSLLTLINPGDIVVVRAGAARKRVVVPDVQPRIDRATDVIRGRVAPRGRLRVEVDPDTGPVRGWSVPIGADGRWRIDTSDDLDLIGGDAVGVTWRVSGDIFRGYGSAPFLEFSPQSNIVFGAGRPGQRVTVEVVRDGSSVGSAATLAAFGSFQGLVETDRGRAVYPRTGDVVTAGIAGGIALAVPRWSISAVGLEDTIRGRCMPDSPYMVEVSRGFNSPAVRRGTTDSTGRFVRRSDALRKGDTVTLTCTYPGGDRLVVESPAD